MLIQGQIHNPATFLAGLGRWMSVQQQQYVVLITEKTYAADLSSSVFTVLITGNVTQTKKYIIHCCSTNFVRKWQTVT